MGVLSDLVVATDGDVGKLLEAVVPSQSFEGTDLKGIDTLKFATLQALLTGHPFEELLPSYRPVATASEEGPWIIKLPSNFVTHLARLTPEERRSVSAKWARTEEFLADRWGPADVDKALERICNFAKKADTSNRSLFLWMSL